ncbi:MOSC domain-containing protein [Effusibacillus lacus]|uniref:MOSC domain-containing protein n=1 Tax=Effusibacillus lacus TaxID=1348429 RepID=A0A292YIB8_9BACL|nr:MOSC domain-containing protein [Effusibacillus lacus]TCS74803.1 MOSC domain-containing protein YiiM [Effusibacillus lacus]GAX88611.1 hypothetical protein EFBL_0223 [Effusibacillus lacus]
MSVNIVSISVGKPATILYHGRELSTGIYKKSTSQPLYLSRLNFDGDGQADLAHHGGPDKAVCVYPFEHYPYWEKELNRTLGPGAFGENLTLQGLPEKDVCIGDIFELGEAIVQVSQPRQPCHKLAKKFDVPDLPVRVQNTGFTGYYFRVLKEGWVTKEKPMLLLERHPKKVSVQFANRMMHHDKNNMEEVKRLLEVQELSENWRQTLLKRLEVKEVDTKRRIEGE